MPKRRQSKAAWRALADDVAAASAPPSARERAASLADDKLFYVDTASGAAAAGTFGDGGTKRERARARALRVDAACEKAAPSRAYPTPTPLRAGKMFNPPPSRALEAVRGRGSKPTATTEAKASERAVAKRATTTSVATRGGGKASKVESGAFDVWSVKAPKARGVNRLAKKLTAPTTKARAVQPEHPGCSFNPPKDAREDVVAVQLAREYKAKQAKYLDPVEIPVSNNVAEANLVNELYFESGFGDDETDEEDDGGDGRLSVNAAVNANKFSKTKRNKMKRRADALAAEEEARKAKKLRHDLSNLKALQREIRDEEEERRAKLERRNAVREERRASQPARLGKLRHRASDADVRFADELDGGSLRTLKPSSALLRDRLKSYERREIIEPRQKVDRKKAKAVIKYEPGARGEKEIALMAEASKRRQEISELRALVSDAV
jgi:nucleolar protein 53